MAAKVLVCGNYKGGTAKSTTSTLLAGAFGELGLNVLLVDADGQGSATKWVARAPEGADFPAKTAGLAKAGMALHREIAKYADGHDLIVVDTPPAVDSLASETAMMAADLLLVPVDLSTLATEQVEGVVRMLNRVKESNTKLQARILPSKVPTRKLGEGERRELKALEDSGLLLMTSWLRERGAFRNAAFQGVTIARTKPKDRKAVAELDALVAEVAGLLGLSI
jgi:chromosome partitioning protein